MMVGLGLLAVVVTLLVLPGVVAGPLSWLLVFYVLWRALPAIRADLARLRGRRGGLALPVRARRQGGWL